MIKIHSKPQLTCKPCVPTNVKNEEACPWKSQRNPLSASSINSFTSSATKLPPNKIVKTNHICTWKRFFWYKLNMAKQKLKLDANKKNVSIKTSDKLM